MTTRLYPPLERIRNELFEAPDRRAASADFSETDDDPRWAQLASEPPPDFIIDLIERQAAAFQAHPPAPPAVGQIRCLSAVPAAAGESRPLTRNVSVLLGAHLGGKRWSGWLVAQEVDYASDRDLVIEADDGPVDPVAGMVQTWNPVRVLIDGQERILGKLSPMRLAAVMALAEAPQTGGGARPRPGKVYGWDLAEGIVVATGTPLGGPDDPRHEYRALYGQLAEEIVAAAQAGTAPAQAQSAQGLWGWLVQTFVRPAWTFGALAASLVLAVLQTLGPATMQTASLQIKPPVVGQDQYRVFEIRLDGADPLPVIKKLQAEAGLPATEIRFEGNETVLTIRLSQAGPSDEAFAGIVTQVAPEARVSKQTR